MISLAKILSGKPISINSHLFFYQPTLQEIIDMGEGVYWSSINVWTLKRKEIIAEENEYTESMDDYDIWKAHIMSNPTIKKILAQSCSIFFKSKVEFFDISNTIYVGEKESGLILDNTSYFLIRDIFSSILPDAQENDENSQYKETDNMSERERQMIAKMKQSQKKIEEAKNPNKRPEDYLGDRILGLVAVGHYTFEQVYNMTMLQFNKLLKKYVDVQNYEIRSMLSPYISSEDGQDFKYWLD